VACASRNSTKFLLAKLKKKLACFGPTTALPAAKALVPKLPFGALGEPKTLF